MTDAIRDSLDHRAHELEVPPVDTTTILGLGMQARRRHRVGIAVGGAAGIGVAATVAAASLMAGGPTKPGYDTDLSAAADASMALYQQVGPIATGTTLHVGEATVDTGTQTSGLYETSVGAVYKIDNGHGSDLYVVDVDGDRARLGETSYDTRVGTEPDSSLVAWTSQADPGSFEATVADAATGQTLGAATFEGEGWAGFDTPQTWIHDTTVYFHLQQGWAAWDTSAANPELVPVPGTKQDVYESAAGVYAEWVPGRAVVRSLDDGAVISTVEMAHNEYPVFSPDGRYLRVFDQDTGATRIVRLSDGASMDLAVEADDRLSWAPSGNLVIIAQGAGSGTRTVKSCDLDTMAANSTPAIHAGCVDVATDLGAGRSGSPARLPSVDSRAAHRGPRRTRSGA